VVSPASKRDGRSADREDAPEPDARTIEGRGGVIDDSERSMNCKCLAAVRTWANLLRIQIILTEPGLSYDAD
jgi:hypothetical protein